MEVVKSKNLSSTHAMSIDIDSVTDPSKDLLEVFEDLKSIESFRIYGGKIKKNNLIRYIVILYSKDTFLNKRIPIPLAERKNQAAIFAGFTKDKKGEFAKQITRDLFQLRNRSILDMIFGYLKFQNHVLWLEINATEQQYEEVVRLRMEPVTSKKDKDRLSAADTKKKLREECKSMVYDLKAYYKEFWGDHDEVKILVKKMASTLEDRAVNV